MATLEEIIAALSAPFPPDWIEFRVGNTDAKKQADGKPKRGQALAYIDARTVMDRLDEVVGPFNWQGEHIACGDGKKVTCRIGIRNPETAEWVWKSDGAGETDYEGEKGSYSDSLKRAAVHWGIGRYLYDLASPWVNVEVFGKSVTIPDAEVKRLRNSLPRPGKPPSATTNKAETVGNKPDPADIQRHLLGKLFAEWDAPAWAPQFWTRKDYGVPVPKDHADKDDWPMWLGRMVGLANVTPSADAGEKLLADNVGRLKDYERVNREGHAALVKHIGDRIDELLPNKTKAA